MFRENNKIVIYTGNYCATEFRYIAKYIFEELFLFDITIDYIDSDRTIIEHGNKRLSWPNIFFEKAESNWLNKQSLPYEPVQFMDLSDHEFSHITIDSSLPIVFGSKGLSVSTDELSLDFDVLGTCFFFLSLYDEVVNADLDSRNRVDFSSTFIARNGLINRPVCNEYISLLKGLLSSHFGVHINPTSFTCKITQDVDVAYFNKVTTPFNAIKTSVVDVVKRKSFGLAFRRLFSYFSNVLSMDPNNTFEFFLKQLKTKNLKSIFYFISTYHNESECKHVNSFDLDMLSLYKYLHDHGHVIALHPFYMTYNDYDRLYNEKYYLQDAFYKSGLSTAIEKSRQHGLQFDARTTFKLLDEIGIKEDSSVYFSEAPGFRASICFDYPVYDLVHRTELSLRESPLICMDTSYVSYLKSSKDFMLQDITNLYKICKYYEGDFVILWHNCKLSNPMVKDVFLKTMDIF